MFYLARSWVMVYGNKHTTDTIFYVHFLTHVDLTNRRKLAQSNQNEENDNIYIWTLTRCFGAILSSPLKSPNECLIANIFIHIYICNAWSISEKWFIDFNHQHQSMSLDQQKRNTNIGRQPPVLDQMRWRIKPNSRPPRIRSISFSDVLLSVQIVIVVYL